MSRIIIFGVPKEEKEVPVGEEKEHYTVNVLNPALQHTLKMEKVDFTLHKIMVSNRDGMFNMVLELPQRDANFLDQSKLSIGLYRCMVRRYIMTPRCYNCQELRHLSKNCENDLACAKCARPHNTASCDDNRRRCVNCFNANRRRSDSDSPIDYQHYSFEGCCQTYKNFQRSYFAQQRQSTSQSHSG